jgi:hypothetical protein
MWKKPAKFFVAAVSSPMEKNSMEKKEKRTTEEKPVQRLCSEIQLFDLCDLEVCNYKEGRFCRQEELLVRFEHIADEDVRTPVRGLSDELEEDEDDEDMGFREFEGDEDDYGQEEDE